MADPDDLQRAFAAMGDAVDDALRPAVEDAVHFLTAMHEALGGDEGITRLRATLDRHAAAAAAWEDEHPGLRFGQHCDCWCQRWGHHGVCNGDADTFHVGQLWGEPVQVPMCTPCSRHVDAALRTR